MMASSTSGDRGRAEVASADDGMHERLASFARLVDTEADQPSCGAAARAQAVVRALIDEIRRRPASEARELYQQLEQEAERLGRLTRDDRADSPA